MIVKNHNIELIFVDDGSTDDTQNCLRHICSGLPVRSTIITLERNHGKGEAVRIGMLQAIGKGAEIVGFADADFSTPANEILRLVGSLRDTSVQVVMGSRIRYLGTDIRRHPWRHLTGRIFATYASAALKLMVYDTQCGAKFFRVTPAFTEAIEKPFKSKWAFDVELIGRLMGSDGGDCYSADDFNEVPLRKWRDVKGSKLTVLGVLHALLEVSLVGWALRRRRNTRCGASKYE